MAQQIDVTFKSLLVNSRGVLARLLFGPVTEWLNVEQPEIRNLRADLLARIADGSLRHVEIQASNNEKMGLRMLEYYVGFQRILGEHVSQTILYVGREPLRMPSLFVTPSVRFEYSTFNLREMDGTELLASDDWADNEFALLTTSDREKVIQTVLEKLRTLQGQEQAAASTTFVIIGGILGIEDEIERRIDSQMIDLMENKVFGPIIRKQLEQALERGVEQGLQQGRQEGRHEGRQEGRVESASRILRRLLEKRFGPLPPWADAKLASASEATLEAWTLRLDDTTPLESILTGG